MNSLFNFGLYLVIKGSFSIILCSLYHTVIIIIMFRNCNNLALLALVATVSAKQCYNAIGTFDLAEGSVDAALNICWPNGSDNGNLGTGTGLYDDGSKKGQALTVTNSWLAADKVLTIWLTEKVGKKENLCSIMCGFDANAVCTGYFSCQPNATGTVSFTFALEVEAVPEPKAKRLNLPSLNK